MMVHAFRLLRWQYLGRLTLAAGIFGGALLVWRTLAPTATLLVTLALVVSLAITLPSYWYTHVAARTPGEAFLYGAIFPDHARLLDGEQIPEPLREVADAEECHRFSLPLRRSRFRRTSSGRRPRASPGTGGSSRWASS